MEKKFFTMLQAVDVINNASKGSSLDEQFIREMHPFEKVISDNLGTNDTQSMLMARFIDFVFDREISIRGIFDGTECTTSRKLELMNEVDELIDNHLIIMCRNRNAEASYSLPNDVVRAFRHNEKYVHKGYQKVTARALFFILEDLFLAREEQQSTYAQLIKEVKALFDVNADMEFVRKLRSFNLQEDDAMLLVLFCSLFVNNDDDNIGWHDIKFLYDSKSTSDFCRSLLLGKGHILIKAHFIENTNAGGFVNREDFKLTERAKRDLLGELHLNSVENGKSQSDVIRHKDIKAKELFFPNEVEKSVGELKDLLQDKNYKSICQRMKKKGFHSGFTCLFYGTPGTGKTETVYQLAKLTGRDVMLVDIPQIRSMWVGESEKNVKGIFERYAGLVKDSKRTPILLFNEADAIIGKRTMNHDSAADKMENTMQNIILQEMENLNGILIATTNLQGNMDRAFERRFLYKIQFDRPDAQSRGKIWHSMIPELNDETVNRLASSFDFSGGQIENIARHYTIETILKGEDVITLGTLQKYCEQESIKKENHKIGFKLQ